MKTAFLALILFLTGLSGQPPFFQNGDVVYFPETGHRVTGEFLKTYQNTGDALELYGYPITEAFTEVKTGLIVQYFQRARFELHPDASPEQRVQLTPIGETLYQPGKPLPSEGPSCRSFPETGFNVCYSFLDFFNQHGGAAHFGYPISGFEDQNGRIVQYFQNARLEWHPEFPSGQRVTVSSLGLLYFDQVKEDPQRKEPFEDSNLVSKVVDLKAFVFTTRSVSTLQGSQTIFVLVQDQNRRPIEGAGVELVVTLPDGQQQHLLMDSTNASGISSISFSYSSSKPGVVKVDAIIQYSDLSQETLTSFRAWW